MYTLLHLLVALYLLDFSPLPYYFKLSSRSQSLLPSVFALVSKVYFYTESPQPLRFANHDIHENIQKNPYVQFMYFVLFYIFMYALVKFIYC